MLNKSQHFQRSLSRFVISRDCIRRPRNYIVYRSYVIRDYSRFETGRLIYYTFTTTSNIVTYVKRIFSWKCLFTNDELRQFLHIHSERHRITCSGFILNYLKLYLPSTTYASQYIVVQVRKGYNYNASVKVSVLVSHKYCNITVCFVL